MKISTSDFEKAVEIGFDHGVRQSLGMLLVPDEWKARVNDAVLDAYNQIVPSIDRGVEIEAGALYQEINSLYWDSIGKGNIPRQRKLWDLRGRAQKLLQRIRSQLE